MKVIIFGLGNFGYSLAIYLTETGNEVIGVDKNMSKVDHIKDKIAHAICIDSTDEVAYNSLPIMDADLAIVAIGENEGAAIITTAILKHYSHLKIISRSLSPIHDTVLQAMDVHNIIQPEQEAAERLTRKLNLKNVIDNFEVDEHFSISEINLPADFVGQTIEELQFRQRFKLNIVTILRRRERKNIFGRRLIRREAVGLPTPETRLEEGDILVVFGSNTAIEDFCTTQKIKKEE